MKKSAKYCIECQESYADRFGFCPVCGSPLKNMENLPGEATPAVEEETTPTDFGKTATIESAATTIPPVSKIEETAPPVVESPTIYQATEVNDNRAIEEDNNDIAPEPAAIPYINAATVAASTNAASNFSNHQDDFSNDVSVDDDENIGSVWKNDGLYHLTILHQPKSYQKYLTMGAILGMFLMCNALLAVWVVGIMWQNPMLEDPDDYSVRLITLADDTPYKEDDPVRKKKDDGGGGGGGGKQDKTDASAGREVPQLRTPPELKPDAKATFNPNAELKQRMSTVGDPKKTQVDPNEPIGIPGSKIKDPSNGLGTGGGLGNGNGPGQGNGNGGGKGNGDGEGSGNGKGKGNGDGDGDGDNLPTPKPKPTPAPRPTPAPEPVGPSEPLKILSKAKPQYTEEARKNQIQGTVRLRVTFGANGQILNVSPISSLPNGLTEKAIEAARQIRFEPAKKGGVPYVVTKEVAFTFNLL